MEFHPRNATRKSTNVLNAPSSIKMQRAQYHPASVTSFQRPAQERPAPDPLPRQPRPCGKSYVIFLFYRGAIPSFAMQNSPLKGAESNAEGAVPPRASHAVPEIRVGKTGIRPAPEIATPQCFAPACSRASIILSVTGSNRIS